MATDVHQHVWGGAFVDALRSRTTAPRLDGWTLRLDGEPAYDADPADHDLDARAALAAADGFDLVLTSLSSPLGVEWLPPEDAAPLLAAYHEDALGLPAPFGAWAAACVSEIDPAPLAPLLDGGLAGLQLPANALLDEAGYARCAPLLTLLESRGLPLLLHPGPAPDPRIAEHGPSWWPALVPYVQQMHAAWFAFRAFGRARHPRLRVCFALLAGLAPLHGERFAARGGDRGEVDRDAFLETFLVRAARHRRDDPGARHRHDRVRLRPAVRVTPRRARPRRGRLARHPGREPGPTTDGRGVTDVL